MFDSDSTTEIASPFVFTSTNRGHSPEEMAEMAMNKIMVVSDTNDPLNMLWRQ